MRCEGCGAEVTLGSAHCGNCGRALHASFDAPPPPPPGWTLADGPARQALLPPPPTKANVLASALTPPKDKKGCGCGVLAVAGVAVVVVAVVGIVVAAIDTVRGETLVGPPLELGDTVRFEIGANDTGQHDLSLGEGAVTITVRGIDDDFDPVLEVKQPDGLLVGRNDDAIGRDSQLSFNLPEGGEFLVEVTEFGNDAGRYEVEVASGATGPVIDPTDLIEGERVPAGPLRVDESLEGSVGTDDTAVHTLEGFEGRVSISVVGVDSFDPVLRVVDEDGAVVGENDDTDGRNSFLTFLLSSSDRFEVEVREFSGDAGIYTIRLQRGDGTQPAVVRGEPLRLNQPVEGAVGEDQVARHEFAGDGQVVAVDVVGLLGFDPVVRVLAPNGDLLAENDDTNGLDSHVEVQLPGAGTATIEVLGFSGQPGAYAVTVT